jgi:hypothetical protein
MKTKSILGCLIVLAVSGYSQATWNGSGTTGNAYRDGRIGINNATPQCELDIVTSDPNSAAGGAGISQNASTGSAALHLYTANSGGKTWSIYSLGNSNHVSGSSSGDFSIFDNSTFANRFIIKGSNGNIGIGTNNPSLAKLQVELADAPIAARFTANGAYGGATATYALVTRVDQWNTSTSAANFGIHSTATASNPYWGTSYAVYGSGENSKYCYGGFFRSLTGGTTANYGIYAAASGAATNWAGYFSGNVYRSGTDNFTSDRKLKNEIEPITNALDKLLQLKPSSYVFKTEEFEMMNLPEGKQMGLIAQDLEQVFPELVTDMPEMKIHDKDGKTTTIPEFKSVQYISLIPILISGIQEQQEIINEQKKSNEALSVQLNDQQSQLENQQKQLDEQKNIIEQLSKKAGVTTGINTNGDITGFQMSQNIPNPFTNETVIKYTLPQTVTQASMVVYDLTGKQITSFPINKNNSSVTITSEKLSAGIYIYSIVADGQLLDSKRMVVAEK